MNINQLLEELNPLKDMARCNNRSTIKEKMIDTVLFPINIIKHIIRGGIYGFAIGTPIGSASSLFVGNEIMQGTEYGAINGLFLGVAIDTGQYITRYINHIFKKDLNCPPIARAAIFSASAGLSILFTYGDFKYKEQLQKVSDLFLLVADNNSNRTIDKEELDSINQQLQNFYGSTNFTSATNKSQLTGTQKADYLRSKGQTPDSKLIYLLEHRNK